VKKKLTARKVSAPAKKPKKSAPRAAKLPFEKPAAAAVRPVAGSLAARATPADAIFRLGQLEHLLEMTKKISSTLKIEEVLRTGMDSAEQVLGAEASSIWEIDNEAGEIFFRVVSAEGASAKDIRLKIGEGISGWVVKHGQPQLIADARLDPRFSRKVDTTTRFVTRSMLCVPLLVNDQCIGAFQLLNKKSGEHFNDDDLYLAQLLAGQIAVALDNARLYQEKKKTLTHTALALADVIEMRDEYTGGHVQRVIDYSMVMGKAMGLDEDTLETLQLSAALHDIGKIAVPDRVLNKQGPLDKEEFESMKKHPETGTKMLLETRILQQIIPGMRSHHERWDGRGYPDHLVGEQSPLQARIIAVADTFDAMTSNRPYRKGLSLPVAIDELKKNSGTQFCPASVTAFLKAFDAGKITALLEEHARRTPEFVPNPNENMKAPAVGVGELSRDL
jgi:HD-GYP domain-containing protein (c-di-GMP phosphodiesterase class II)